MSTPNCQLPTSTGNAHRHGWWLAGLFATWSVAVGSYPAAQGAAVLENDHVIVTRDAAPCAAAGPGCGDTIVVVLGEPNRGAIAVHQRGERYAAPTGKYFEVNVRPSRPPVKSPAVLIPPDKNSILFDGDDFFIFEEKLDPGDTRARHSHRERVVIVLNKTRLQQWPDGSPEVFRDQVPDDVHFNAPVVHVVKTVGDAPLRNIVIEFKK